MLKSSLMDCGVSVSELVYTVTFSLQLHVRFLKTPLHQMPLCNLWLHRITAQTIRKMVLYAIAENIPLLPPYYLENLVLKCQVK